MQHWQITLGGFMTRAMQICPCTAGHRLMLQALVSSARTPLGRPMTSMYPPRLPHSPAQTRTHSVRALEVCDTEPVKSLRPGAQTQVWENKFLQPTVGTCRRQAAPVMLWRRLAVSLSCWLTTSDELLGKCSTRPPFG